MKVLFVTAPGEDYLADGLLIGFRRLFGSDCIEYPKKDILYSNCPDTSLKRIRGGGFTLYTGLLEDLPVDRASIIFRIQQDEFDLIVFSDIWRQYGLFVQWCPYLNPKKTIICDGQDTPQVYPYAGLWWRRISQWFAPRAHTKFLYFKREWREESQFNLWHRCLPKYLLRHLHEHKMLRLISFSIPSEKMISEIPDKTKDFAVHCVDPEVASKIPECKTSYAFTTETDYYFDLQCSRFAITTKRAGWDCLRHYEIAANGCIPCFRDLDKKPKKCAPHGLDTTNCIIYSNAEDLLEQISRLSEPEVTSLQAGALKWAQDHSCEKVVSNILNQVIKK